MFNTWRRICCWYGNLKVDLNIVGYVGMTKTSARRHQKHKEQQKASRHHMMSIRGLYKLSHQQITQSSEAAAAAAAAAVAAAAVEAETTKQRQQPRRHCFPMLATTYRRVMHPQPICL